MGSVQDGLGGGIEIVGGVWSLLVSWSALRGGEFPRALNGLGILVGVVGILTVGPGREISTAVFGLGQLVWFIWVGTLLLRTVESRPS